MSNYVENGNADGRFHCNKEKGNIFLIGDSIREGYCKTVKKELSDVAEVFYIGDNCRHTQNVITSLRSWAMSFVDRDYVNIVQFNCGHWDVAHWNGYETSLTSPEEYAKNIKMIIYIIKKYFVNAKIVFATTTPMNPTGEQGVNPRSTEEIIEYNKIAKKAIEGEDVILNDLYEFTREWGSESYEDYCHYTKENFEILGKEVARKLRELL